MLKETFHAQKVRDILCSENKRETFYAKKKKKRNI